MFKGVVKMNRNVSLYDLLSIGQMAKLNNMSTQTLRFYEKMMLIDPIKKNKETGYRHYDIRQSACLDMIQYMKSLGLSLKEIRELLEENDIDVIMEVLEKKNAEIESQIESLTITRRAIGDMVKDLKKYKSIPEQGQIVCETIPERMIHSHRVEEDYYAKGHIFFEAAARKLKETLIGYGIPMSYFCNVGSIIGKDTIAAGHFIAEKIFIKADAYTAKLMPTEILPAGIYLCVYFENYLHERRYAKKLTDHIKASALSIEGDYVAEVIAEVPVFRKAERNTFIKIQIRVK